MSDFHPEDRDRMLESSEPVHSAAAVLASLALVAAIILAGLFLLPADDLDTAYETTPTSTTGGPSE
jgi:hypothetical protein